MIKSSAVYASVKAPRKGVLSATAGAMEAAASEEHMRKFNVLCLAAIMAAGNVVVACGTTTNDGACFDTADYKCDGSKVDGVTDSKTDTGSCAVKTWYRDADADGYGRRDDKVEQCLAPPQFVGQDSDCNDANSVVHPGADEVCDSLDNDCDGTTDEASCTGGTANGNWAGYVKIEGGTKVCFSTSGFDSTYQSLDAFLVGNALTWTTNADRRTSPSGSYFCYDMSGLSTGTYQLTVVSTKRTNGDSLATGVDMGGGPSYVVWFKNYDFCKSGVQLAKQFCVKTSTSSAGWENFLIAVRREGAVLVPAGNL